MQARRLSLRTTRGAVLATGPFHRARLHLRLLILCNAWLGSAAAWPNLTLKKIPNAVLGRCEFGRDDYSLQVASLPAAPESNAAPEPAAAPATPRRRGRKRAADPAQESILDVDSEA
jgi:adenine-specific DNA-methyltransferase